MAYLVIQRFEFGKNELCEKPIVERCNTMAEVAEAWARFRRCGVKVENLEVFEIGADLTSDPDTFAFLETNVA